MSEDTERLWAALQLHHERLAALEAAQTQRSKKARPASDAELLEYCSSLGLKPVDADWFTDKMEASGWRNNGKPVACWKALIRVWKGLGIFPSQKNHQNGSQVNVTTLQRILEQKRDEAKRFRNAHVAEYASGPEWDSHASVMKHQAMKTAINQLQAKLDSQIGITP